VKNAKYFSHSSQRRDGACRQKLPFTSVLHKAVAPGFRLAGLTARLVECQNASLGNPSAFHDKSAEEFRSAALGVQMPD